VFFGERVVGWGGAQPLLQLYVRKSAVVLTKKSRFRVERRLGVLFIGAFMLSGCLGQQGCIPSSCGGPERLIPSDQELVPIKERYNLANVLRVYDSAPTADKIAVRNEFLFERVYAMDVSYTAYEEALTKESENEGFLAAAINAGLTGAGALVPVAQTTRLLSQIALGMTTLDQAYNKQYLLSKAVQVLQSQMRSRRADVLTHIIARTKTGIAEYPLGMAMSDLEEYYRAGTLAAAFVDLTQNAGTDAIQKREIKDQIKPGAAEVARAARETISNVSAPLPAPVQRPPVTSATRLTDRERDMSTKDIKAVQKILCVTENGDIGGCGSVKRIKLSEFLKKFGKPPASKIDDDVWANLQELRLSGKRNC
jgi:hypothetical protein